MMRKSGSRFSDKIMLYQGGQRQGRTPAFRQALPPCRRIQQVFNAAEISGTVWGLGKGFFMKRGVAVSSSLAGAVFALALGVHTAAAQSPPQCDAFRPLSMEAQKRADAVQTAMKAKVDRKQICTLMTTFVSAEDAVIKFLVDNKTWCGVPDQAIAVSKANHEKSVKFRTAACSEATAAEPKAPSLSDAIKTPTVDSAGNTKTGPGGTFDTLTGNPLGK
jgi:hypothetical protein